MSSPSYSVFQTALQVSPERIASITDRNLDDLMLALFRAQSYRCGSPTSQLRVNTEGRAKDDGSDGWTAKPTSPDAWLGDSDTCWQFKAGDAGEPARLAGEVTKPIPADTLRTGGRFVVVASGSTNGKKGEDDRRRVLVAEAKAAGLPIERIDVIGSERLTEWCNQLPAVAARWAGRPSGLWTLQIWAGAPPHQVGWQATPEVTAELLRQRANLDFDNGSVHHLHVRGQPGVGKTRFALELCRDAAWSDFVVYIQQAADVRLLELINSAAEEQGVRLLVVADEIQLEQLIPLRDAVARASGRIRLVTVGHCHTPDPARIPAITVSPIDEQRTGEIVRAWHPSMPPEHVDFIARFADGYIRLAQLAAGAVTRNPTIDVRGLLGLEEVRLFLDKMLGAEDRRSLHVVAVLSRVGWTEEKQNEGQSVAQHLELDWNNVRAQVDRFHHRLGIAPRGGRYRYISPTPLGIYLAVEAWAAYPELLRTLPDVLPSEGAREAYYERLTSIASNPQARDYAREELSAFFSLKHFVDDAAASRWSALSAADPILALQGLLRALEGASPEERKRIDNHARRNIVAALVRLAWPSSSFHGAARALALLAEGETESWANNATGEFLARFQVILGGTALPYLDRLPVLDELLPDNRLRLNILVVLALARVGDQHVSRMGGESISHELPELEWGPANGTAHRACIEAAVARLTDLATRALPELYTSLVTTADHLSMLLREKTLRTSVSQLFEAIVAAYPDAREPLRKVISDLLYRERHIWKKLPLEDLAELAALEARFEGDSVAARLRKDLGYLPWQRDDRPDLAPLAQELVASPEALAENWSWLTSGEASDAFRLGQTLAAADPKQLLSDVLPTLPKAGPDLRLLCGYVCTVREQLGEEWYDRWVDAQLRREPKPVSLLFEMSMRCGATDATVDHLIDVLRTEVVSPNVVGQLEFGRWGQSLKADTLEELLRAMIESGHSATALVLLRDRMESAPTERSRWSPLALQLVLTPELIRGDTMTSFHWKELAKPLVKDHAGAIADAVVKEQADRSKETWFAEYSEARTVLLSCTEQDPQAVWKVLLPYLSSIHDAYMMSIGFPSDVFDHLPGKEVMAWVGENPSDRAPLIAKLVGKDLSTDETLPALLLGAFGEDKEVASSYLGEFVSGSWSGPASLHWRELSETLDAVAKRTRLPKLKRWASSSASHLRRMEERDREREAEDRLHLR